MNGGEAMTPFNGRMLSVLALLLLTSCATRSMSVPLVDPISITDPAKYTRDLADCGALARQNNRRGLAADNFAGGAATGAAFGAATGAIIGASPGRTAGLGALTGGTSGATAGAVTSETAYQTIYMNCMRGRGWTVLGLTADPQIPLPAVDPSTLPEIDVQYIKLPELGLWERMTEGGLAWDWKVRCALGDTGCVLGELRPRTTRETWFGVHPTTEGIVVMRVTPGSSWERAGIIPGTLIHSINGVHMTADNHAKWAVEMTKFDSSVTVLIKQDGQLRVVGIKR